MIRLLMCRPDYFGVKYDINPWMTNQIGKVDIQLAYKQWTYLKVALQTCADVSTMMPWHDCPDMVFTANAGFVLNDIVVLSNFAKSQRKNEEIHFYEWFKDNNLRTIYQPAIAYEGEGDHLVDCYDRHWLGTGFRTSPNIKSDLDVLCATDVNVLELIDSRFYHLDTAFCPLPNGEILYYPGAFSEASNKKIESAFIKKIAVTEKEALSFCCNAIIIKNTVFMPECEEAALRLHNEGYYTREFDLSEFLKAGGAVKCLVLKLNKE